MTKRRIVRSAVSVFLSFALVLSGIMPGTPLVKTVQAAEEETTINITPAKTADEDASREGKGTMSISLKIKKTPAASDFTFTAPTALMYDGTAKEASVVTADGVVGMGDFTVEYYSGDTKLDAAPTAEGTYTVKVNVTTEGDEYKKAEGVTAAAWTFTITPQTKTMTITLSIHGHKFAYSADKSTITAACNGEIGTCNLTDKQVVLNLIAPTKKVDTDSGSAEATLDADELAAFNEATGLSVKASDIEYYEGGAKLDAAPAQKGDYTAKLTVGDGDNKATAEVDYSIGTSTQTKSMTITLTIAAAEVKTAPAANALTYNGSDQALVTTGEAKAGTMQYQLGESDTTAPSGEWSDEVPTGKAAGTYYVWYRSYVGGQNVTTPICVPVEILAVTLTDSMVTIEPTAYDYNGETRTPDITVKNGETPLVKDTDYTVDAASTTSASNTSSGDGYVVKITGTGNYTGTVTKYWKINKVASSGEIEAVSGLVYDGKAKNLVAEKENTVKGGTVMYRLGTDGAWQDTIPQGKAAGEYTVYYYVKGDANHSDQGSENEPLDPVNATIAKCKVTVSGIQADHKEYDGTKTAALDYSGVTFTGIAEGDALTVTATGTFENANAADGKKVNISGLTLGGEDVANYELADSGQQDNTTANITKKSVTVTPDANQSKVYGAADPVFKYTADGLVGEEALSGALTRAAGEAAGEYAYTVDALDLANTNYSVSLAADAPKFAIKKAALTITADAKTITYGDSDAVLTYQVEGLTDGDTADKVVTGALTREAGTDAGTYKITQGTLASANYGITFVGADYVIKKALQAKPAESFTTAKATGSNAADGRISGFDTAKAYQYSADEGKTWTDVKAGDISIAVKAGTYQIRYAGDKNHEAGTSMSVTVEKKADQGKPEGLESDNASAEDAADGAVTGTDDTMEYSVDGGKTWTAVPDSADKISELPAGEVLVRYAGTEDKNPGEAVTVTIGVASKTEGVVSFKTEEGSAPVETAVEAAQSSNIEAFAKSQVEEGKEVKVELEITPKNEENVNTESVAEIGDKVKEVFAGIASEKVVTEYLEIDLAKFVDSAKAGNISDTGMPLEIELTFDKTKMGNPVVIRTHAGKAKAFDRLPGRPDKDFRDGTYHLGDGKLYLYSQYFSDFAIVYATEKTYNVGIVTGTGDSFAQIVAEGGRVTLPEGLVKEGFAFDGWYRDEAYTSAWSDSDTVNADITLYAKWNKSVSGVTATPESVKLTQAGEATQLQVTVTPEDAANKKVTYTSSDANVAAVDENGRITAVANGTAAITVTTEDGKKTAVVKVTVEIPEITQQGLTQEEKVEIAMNAGLKVTQTGSKINIKWGKVKEADGYEVYVAYCGTKYGKAVKTITKNSKTSVDITKLNGKKINLKKNFKVYVAAYRLVDGKKVRLARTIAGHVVGRKNASYTNAKRITLAKSKYTVKIGKTAKIKAKTVLVDQSKKQLSDGHAKEFRYASSNKKIATVDKSGKITGVSAGTCTIYVYARNGYAKKVSVTVK